MEFTEEQWHGLKQHADERSLQFLSSPFSMEAVELLTRVGVSAWKIASGEVSNTPMFERIVDTGLPILLSTGMSPLSEIDATVELINAHNIPLTVLQCTSMYPTPPEKLGLNLISFFRERYGCKVGLSDHSGAIYAGLAAATLGAEALEVHITFNREMFGPDVPASLTTDELRQLVDGVRYIERMNSHPVDKDAIAGDLAGMRKLFTKSVVTRVPLSKGIILFAEHLTTKKPGTGIPAERLSEIIGRKLSKDVDADHLLEETDLE
jgi:N,N'-diacetyllegionaminate synthase